MAIDNRITATASGPDKIMTEPELREFMAAIDGCPAGTTFEIRTKGVASPRLSRITAIPPKPTPGEPGRPAVPRSKPRNPEQLR